ncbi:N-acetylmuramoyl-L-alanine amidase [Streptosporangium sp. CA-135522]|uniref:golvesin C-terminal-like domain-containing protein n=1 Tax=Streptosporangium sp. CA-135522 TaxID=3240072 RepID=UPI003D8ED883
MTFARTRLAAIATCLLTALLVLAGRPANAAPADPLAGAFADAAAARDVPRDLLVALAYAETHLDGHNGQPSASGGYGVMHLVSNPTNHTLEKAAELTGQPARTLRTSDAANIAGGAAVLRAYADELGLDDVARKDIGRWYPAVAKYGNASTPEVARLYADTVYDLLGTGLQAAKVKITAQEVHADRGAYAQARELNAQVASADYPDAAWVAASSSNYTASSRPSSYAVDRVIIHVTQGSYAGTISWFQNPSAQVSAHYVVRSSDGAITQMVREKDIAWHAGNWSYNTRSVGIEHEGYVSDASWFTDAMYRASAALTRNICDRYGIPKDRSHILGHVEVPGADHTDPGPYWDWNKYMQYVTGGGTPSWTTTVDNATAGKFAASANWGTSAYSGQRYGADYRFAGPVSASDPAWYRASIPSSGSYRVEVWYPADPGYNSSAPYIVATSGGNQTVYVDQRSGGGGWHSIGNFSLNAGDHNVVGVSRWTSGTGYVIADAVRITRV